MAQVEVKSVELTVMERQWIRKALETQRMVLTRSRDREMEGGEVRALRNKEIEAVNRVLDKF